MQTANFNFEILPKYSKKFKSKIKHSLSQSCRIARVYNLCSIFWTTGTSFCTAVHARWHKWKFVYSWYHHLKWNFNEISPSYDSLSSLYLPHSGVDSFVISFTRGLRSGFPAFALPTSVQCLINAIFRAKLIRSSASVFGIGWTSLLIIASVISFQYWALILIFDSLQ